jgi:signal transduction histidine kinase/AraC-like DNA-binding protein
MGQKARILVIDDEPQFERLMLQRFRRKLRAGVYEFLFAQNGLEALDVIQQDTGIEMVLTDLNMPKMDGLSFLARLRDIRPGLKTVVVSAYGDMKNIRAAMNLGAFDFVTKPIEFQDLETTIEKTLNETATLKKAEHAKELEAQNTHLEELDKMKTQFFTNISHEFRTPLTVISGMAEQIEENPERWTHKGLAMIKRNSHNLLDLVNQILDLRKLESGKLSANYVLGDVVAYIQYIMDSFHALAEAQDIQLRYQGIQDALEMDYDPEKLLRILSNLLDNAIKFTPAGGQISLETAQADKQFIIKVTDTGIGIAEDQLPNIFERFFYTQASPATAPKGSGIGLSLVKELVRLMGGEIAATSKLGEGTTFDLRLPIHQNADRQGQDVATSGFMESKATRAGQWEALKLASQQRSEAELPSLLIMEDNLDVAQYLVACLEGRYRLAVVHDGQAGIDKALTEVPDLIISDVMMPEKNGYEVCQTLKSDDKTSHIPIVLLTAKADTASRIEGFEHGADAYLAKPFEKKELLIRLEKLLELREQLQARYRSAEGFADSSERHTQKEDKFVISLRQVVEEHIDDENFGIKELCKAMLMSRTQLHRKVKALTGRSTSSFVRSIRLGKAKELLANTDWNIAQIAYEVGFKDPKYFSRTFAEEFGLSPKLARK